MKRSTTSIGVWLIGAGGWVWATLTAASVAILLLNVTAPKTKPPETRTPATVP